MVSTTCLESDVTCQQALMAEYQVSGYPDSELNSLIRDSTRPFKRIKDHHCSRPIFSVCSGPSTMIGSLAIASARILIHPDRVNPLK